MKIKNIALVAGLFASIVLPTQAVEILRDNFTATNSTGALTPNAFDLAYGPNSGINPPTTRLTGALAPNLRYILRDTSKTNSAYGINNNKLRVTSEGGAGRFVLSANGTTPFDFAPALGLLAASPTNKAVYEISINMDNDSASNQRMSFAIGTQDGNNGTWDFGVQIFRPTTGDANYSVAHRIDGGSSGTADVTATISTNNAGTFGSEITIKMRITDAGAETNGFNSQVQLFLNGSATPFYDTATDPLLPNGWRFDAAIRYIMWDVAPSAVARYDSFFIDTITTPTLASQTWTGGASDDNWSSSDNWGGVPLASGSAIVFNGNNRQSNFNDVSGLSVPVLTFNNGDFVLSGNSVEITGAITNLAGVNTLKTDLSFNSTAGKFWNIASGSELILSNTTSVEVNGDHFVDGGGILRLNGAYNVGVVNSTATPAFTLNDGTHIVDGGTITSRGGYRIGSLPSGSGARMVLTNGATMTVTASGANVRIGDAANPNTTTLEIDNSTLSMAGGNLYIPFAAGATGVVTQVGGSVSGGTISFSDGAGSGTYTIKNGILEALRIRKIASAGIGSIYFDNAILRGAVGANSASFFTGLNVAEIQSGGLTIDGTVDVTIAQSLSGSGVLTKTGSSIVTLTGTNSYTGNTVIQGGRLTLPTVQTNTAAITVADGAELGVGVKAPETTLTASTATLGSSSGAAITFDLGNFTNPSAPMLKVNNLNANTPVTVNVANGFQLALGQITLIDYDVLSGSFDNFTLIGLPPGVTATLVHNTANTSIDLNFTSVPGLRWTGAVDNTWDTFTQNWLSLQTGGAASFSDGFPTEFFDGASNTSINVSIFPNAPVMTVSNNATPYAWNGGIITTPLLKKFGTNSLTRTGGEIDMIGTIELNEGSYIFDNAFDATVTNILKDTTAGLGAYVKQGAGAANAAADNSTFDGQIVVAGGTMKMTAAAGGLGSTNGSTTITNGGTLDLNNKVYPHEPVFVSGSGVGGIGAIIDTTTDGNVANNLTDVTMLGDTVFGCPNTGRWDLRVRSGTGVGPGLRGNGFNLTKVGNGAVSIACQRHNYGVGVPVPYWQMNLGDVFINEGSLTFAESLELGNPSKTISIAAGASMGTFDLNETNPIVRNITVGDGASISSSGGSGATNRFDGSVQMAGAFTLRPLDSTMVINGPITGSGPVTVSSTGVGTLLLNGANTYTSDTTVSTGTLGGTGSLAGSLNMTAATNAPGYNGIGTFSVAGNVTLGSLTKMEIDRAASPNSDRIVAGGDIAFGGTLQVVLAAGASAPQTGDTYLLFNKGSSSTFSSVILPTLGGGMAWNTDNLNVNGTISVTGPATPPSITTVSVSGGNLVLSGTGGVEGGNYYVLSSTNLSIPMVNWTPVETNVFGPGGAFSFTNAISPSIPATFFRLQLP